MKNRRGFGLVEVMVATGLVGVTTLGMMGGLKYLHRSQRIIDKRSDVETIRTGLLQRLDCTKTFLPVNMAVDCSGPVAARKRIVLRDRFGNPVTSTATLSPAGKFAGSAHYAQFFYLLAYCDQASTSLVIRAAKGDGTNFLPLPEDPIHEWDFYGSYVPAGASAALPPRPALFGEGSLPICASQFGGADTIAQCNPGQYMEGINLTKQTPICKTLPPPPPPLPTGVASCPAGQYARAISTTAQGVFPVCADLGGAISVRTGFPSKISTNADGTSLWNSVVTCQAGEVAIGGGGRCPGGHTAGVRPSAVGNTNANQAYFPVPGPIGSSYQNGWIHNCVTAQDLKNEPNFAVCLKVGQ